MQCFDVRIDGRAYRVRAVDEATARAVASILDAVPSVRSGAFLQASVQANGRTGTATAASVERRGDADKPEAPG